MSVITTPWFTIMAQLDKHVSAGKLDAGDFQENYKALTDEEKGLFAKIHANLLDKQNTLPQSSLPIPGEFFIFFCLVFIFSDLILYDAV